MSAANVTEPLSILRTAAKTDGSLVQDHDLSRTAHQAPPGRYAALHLVCQLCDALTQAGVLYCHWKSNDALDRSASGENDLDLLVGRADVRRFTEILYRLGFKEVQDAPHQRMPGVQSYYGYDGDTEKLVHVHAHYQLVLGHDMTKNYRIPIETPYLQSAVQQGLFKVPKPEFEFILFVLRMVLKHSTGDTILTGHGPLSDRERQELAYLRRRTAQTEIHRLLERHLPCLDARHFERCQESLRPDCPIWRRVLVGHRLQTALRTHARRSTFRDATLKLARRLTRAIRRRLFGRLSKSRLVSGGAMIALVGGDGAGKTTALAQLYAWLAKDFDMITTHLGKPRWSWTTISVRGILKIGQVLGLYPVETCFRKTLTQTSLVSPGYPWLLREVCRARDRHRTYARAQRFAAHGGLVLLDRFPLPQIRLMDGPHADRFLTTLTNGSQTSDADAQPLLVPHPASRLAKALVRLEQRYYSQIAPPDLLFVLRVDPRIAIGRKTDDDPISVRDRSTEVWQTDWDATRAHVIDASRPAADVLSELKSLIWSNL